MSKKQLQRQLYDARTRYHNWVKKLESEGFVVPDELKDLPPIPKKITPGSVDRVKKLTEKLKKESRIEIGGQKYNRQSMKIRESAIKRRRKKQLAKNIKEYGKDEAERIQDMQRDYSDRPEYDLDQMTPPPVEPDVSPDEGEIVDYVQYVLDMFMNDIHELADSMRQEGMSPQFREELADAEDFLDDFVSDLMNDPDNSGYAFAKGLEEAKRQNSYITREDMYKRQTAEAFVMRIESFMNFFDPNEINTENLEKAIDNINKAQSNVGYENYSADEAEEIEGLINPKKWYEDDLFGDE